MLKRCIRVSLQYYGEGEDPDRKNPSSQLKMDSENCFLGIARGKPKNNPWNRTETINTQLRGKLHVVYNETNHLKAELIKKTI